MLAQRIDARRLLASLTLPHRLHAREVHSLCARSTRRMQLHDVHFLVLCHPVCICHLPRTKLAVACRAVPEPVGVPRPLHVAARSANDCSCRAAATAERHARQDAVLSVLQERAAARVARAHGSVPAIWSEARCCGTFRGGCSISRREKLDIRLPLREPPSRLHRGYQHFSRGCTSTRIAIYLFNRKRSIAASPSLPQQSSPPRSTTIAALPTHKHTGQWPPLVPRAARLHSLAPSCPRDGLVRSAH